METKPIPETNLMRDVDYEATLFVCGYTAEEAQSTDNVVIRCRICGAPMMRKVGDIRSHPDRRVDPCKDCQRAFAALRRIMWQGRVREHKNAYMRQRYADNREDMQIYSRRMYYALQGTSLDKNVYANRMYYVSKGVKV